MQFLPATPAACIVQPLFTRTLVCFSLFGALIPLLKDCAGYTVCVCLAAAAVCVCRGDVVIWLGFFFRAAPEESFEKSDWTTQSWSTSKQIGFFFTLQSFLVLAFHFWHLPLQVSVTLCRRLTSDTCSDLVNSCRLRALWETFRGCEAQLLTGGFSSSFIYLLFFLSSLFVIYIFILIVFLIQLKPLLLSLFSSSSLALFSLLRRSLSSSSPSLRSDSRCPSLPYIFVTDTRSLIFLPFIHLASSFGQHCGFSKQIYHLSWKTVF